MGCLLLCFSFLRTFIDNRTFNLPPGRREAEKDLFITAPQHHCGKYYKKQKEKTSRQGAKRAKNMISIFLGDFA
jgi:hypothetical protein